MHINQNLLKTLKEKGITLDPGQNSVLEKLNLLNLQILDYKNEGFFTSLLKTRKPPKGMYLYGGVGKGKSMLMDLFHQNLDGVLKTRLHFHEFMKSIHKELKALREKNKDQLLKEIAKNIRAKAEVLCLDELEIHDIVDAMLVGNLFKYLLEEGVILVITSNRHPDELYKDGLQREKFLEFIDLIKSNLNILIIDTPHDYRLKKLTSLKKLYLHPLNETTSKTLKHSFSELTDWGNLSPKEITVNGRKLTFKDCYQDIGYFTFDELCKNPLGSADYLALAEEFNLVFIRNVPVLYKEDRNEARRFSMLIDVLYDHKITTIISAEAEAPKLYAKGDGAFEFERTVSRLIEMQSEEYLANSKGSK